MALGRGGHQTVSTAVLFSPGHADPLSRLQDRSLLSLSSQPPRNYNPPPPSMALLQEPRLQPPRNSPRGPPPRLLLGIPSGFAERPKATRLPSSRGRARGRRLAEPFPAAGFYVVFHSFLFSLFAFAAGLGGRGRARGSGAPQREQDRERKEFRAKWSFFRETPAAAS